jgi:RNA polymerase sigma-70 factor (ECF subfamily)
VIDTGEPEAAVVRPEPIPTTFDELYRRDLRPLLALAYGLSGSRGAAEELVQEAFLAAHRRWERLCLYDDPGAWLRRVVVNRSVSGVRRRVAEARALARLGHRRTLPDELPARDEEVWRAVRALPGRQAQVVALHYLDDRSVAEVATILGCTDGTVKTHLHRARRALAAALDAPDPGEADPPTRPGSTDRAPTTPIPEEDA